MIDIASLKRSWTVWPGIAMMLIAAYFLISNTLFWATAETAEGTVVGQRRMEQIGMNQVHNQQAKAAVVLFRDTSNREHFFVSNVGSGSGLYREGTELTVLYQAVDPSRAKIRTFKSLYLGPLLLLFMGTVFAFFGIWFMPQDLDRKTRFIKNK